MVAVRDSVKFLSPPIFIVSHEISVLQAGVKLTWFRVYVTTYEVFIFLQESFDKLPEDLVGNLE